MYLFFDTETTGLPRNWNAPVEELENWPRVVQLAWSIHDAAGFELVRHNYIIKPVGFVIPDDAARVHGITTEKALKEGVDLGFALGRFVECLERSSLLVAHNISYDEAVVGSELLRLGLPNPVAKKAKYCTMKTPLSPGERWPKLIDLHTKLFGTGFDKAHDAMNDVSACARCFFEIRKRANGGMN